MYDGLTDTQLDQMERDTEQAAWIEDGIAADEAIKASIWEEIADAGFGSVAG